MSGRIEQSGIHEFVYTEYTVGLKRQGPGVNDAGRIRNKAIMQEGLKVASSRAKRLASFLSTLAKENRSKNPIEFKNIEKNYKFFEYGERGFANLPTWAQKIDIVKNKGQTGYVLLLDRDLLKGIGRTVVCFVKIPDYTLIESIRGSLLKFIKSEKTKF